MISTCCPYIREGLYKDVEPRHVYSCIAMLNECAIHKGPFRECFVPQWIWRAHTCMDTLHMVSTVSSHSPRSALWTSRWTPRAQPPHSPPSSPNYPCHSLIHPFSCSLHGLTGMISLWWSYSPIPLFVPFFPLSYWLRRSLLFLRSFVRVFWHCDLCHGLYLLPEIVCPWVSIKN